MLDRPLLRRMVTIPTVIVAFALASVTLPALLVASLLVDLWRVARGGPGVAARMVLFLWIYLMGEVLALVGLGLTGLLPARQSRDATYRLQGWWTSWNFGALRLLFDLSVTVDGSEHVVPAPILLLVRHASMVDTLLPGRFVTRVHGIRLRYVLKKELLVDPVLDIGGSRLPNHFVSRGAGASTDELAAIRALATGMSETEGVLIYPEGTRFSEEKRDRYVAAETRRGGVAAALAAGLERVLPPRPGGVLALLDATRADVVVLAHRGLEGLARVKDIWEGGLVGSQVDVSFWRIPRSLIPESRSERVEWLYRVWSDVDAWVAGKSLAR